MSKKINVMTFTVVANENLEDATVLQWRYNLWKVSDPMAAVRAAIKAFLATPVGQDVLERNCGCFNWGDVVFIPDKFFTAQGLQPVQYAEAMVCVDRNEQLC